MDLMPPDQFESYRRRKDKYSRWKSRLRKSGWTIKGFHAAMDAQKARCGICGYRLCARRGLQEKIPGHLRRACVDHDHATGKPRGVLCLQCNTLLGMARDNPRILKSALGYLRKYSDVVTTLTKEIQMSRLTTRVSANERRSIVSRYNKGIGLVAIGDHYGYSATVVRRVLTEANVEIRGRGRPVLA